MTNKEQLPEEEYQEDILEMTDEDGNVERFYHLATLEYKGSLYGVFELVAPASDEEDGGYVFSMEEDGDELILNEVEDDEIADAVFQMYLDGCEEYADDEQDDE